MGSTMVVAAGKTGAKRAGDRLADRPAETGRISAGSDAPLLCQRHDWTEFRDPNRIANKAGVKFADLPKVVVKELVDNALDAAGPGGTVRFGPLAVTRTGDVRFFVANDGDGIPGTDEEVADLFSISRPLTSSKSVRQFSRGALGNGSRVVAGVVLVCGGELAVYTRGRRLELRTRFEDGTTEVVGSEPWAGTGTQVEVTLRGTVAQHANPSGDLFDWGQTAKELAKATATGGRWFAGKSSPHWYDPAAFFELVRGVGGHPVRRLVTEQMDGLSGRDKARSACGEAWERGCETLTRAEADALLLRLQAATSPPSGDRLGRVGPGFMTGGGYSKQYGTFDFHGAVIPFVVEAWACAAGGERPEGQVCVNRTPVCGDVVFQQEKGSEYGVIGCGLRQRFPAAGKSHGPFRIVVNVLAPALPLTTTGKMPDLSPGPLRRAVLDAAGQAVKRAKKKCRKAATAAGQNQKGVIVQHLADAARKLSSGGEFMFSLRQLYYELRPLFQQVFGRDPEYNYFSRVVGEYEDENGDVDGLYRDDRGSAYIPHYLGGTHLNLGTRSVAGFAPPAQTVNKLLFIEKSGFNPMLLHARWPERYDCGLFNTGGFSTRCVRDYVRKWYECGGVRVLFVVHDADGPGTVIYEKVCEVGQAVGVPVVNLGLEPAEGRAMGLTVEEAKRKDGSLPPVAGYVEDPEEREWLQRHRIELNAMPPRRFIDWMTDKVVTECERLGLPLKVVPTGDEVIRRAQADVRAAVERRVVDAVLRRANIPGLVETELARHQSVVASGCERLTADLPGELSRNPARHWVSVVGEHAERVAAEIRPDSGERSASR